MYRVLDRICGYTGSSGHARSTRADSTHAQYKNVRVCIVNALKLPAKWVLFSIIHLDSTGAKSRSCGFFQEPKNARPEDPVYFAGKLKICFVYQTMSETKLFSYLFSQKT